MVDPIHLENLGAYLGNNKSTNCVYELPGISKHYFLMQNQKIGNFKWKTDHEARN